MSLNDSLRLSESLIANDMKLSLNHTSGKMIGQVTVDEIDKNGDILFSETTYNDITLGGSIFVLEQIFKRASSQDCTRFNASSDMPIITEGKKGTTKKKIYNKSIPVGDVSDNDRSSYISDEYIFGFMVGNGGEAPSGIVSPKYESNVLVDQNNTPSFLPLRISPLSKTNPVDNNMDYYLKCENGDDGYYYAKAFNSAPKIYTKWSDGSGPVLSDGLGAVGENKITLNVPILTYGEISLNICEEDIREYFEKLDDGLENCYINQLGLVAGKPVWVEDKNGRWKSDGNGSYTKITNEDELNNNNGKYRLDFDDIHLVTTLNFKTKELSNNENTIKFTYKIYCL